MCDAAGNSCGGGGCRFATQGLHASETRTIRQYKGAVKWVVTRAAVLLLKDSMRARLDRFDTTIACGLLLLVYGALSY